MKFGPSGTRVVSAIIDGLSYGLHTQKGGLEPHWPMQSNGMKHLLLEGSVPTSISHSL
jgi:hypothetical protein